MTCACSCNRSYSAREMVTISSVLLVCISLFSMQTLYHKTRQAEQEQGIGERV